MANKEDIYFMSLAIAEAEVAFAEGEVPVGAVIVCDGKVVASARNARESGKNALRHAELDAISKACDALGGWRLHRCTLYVTLEPCPMCAGAAVNARIGRVVFGAKDARAGAFGSVINLNSYPLNHKPEITAGVCGESCRALMSRFFEALRRKNKQKQR